MQEAFRVACCTRPRARALALAFVGVLCGQTRALDAPPHRTFEPAQVKQGAVLAAIGDCITCHTAPDGRAYAGGRPLTTPFGTVYGTNITPDLETGIGAYTEREFARAMREGVARDGRELYPAFPYDHFRRLGDDDLRALYAFMMTREPVSAARPRNDLRFPFNFRPLIGAWKALFLHGDRATGEATSEERRGEYLVSGIGHCGACHTPRNLLGAEKRDRALSGGEAEGWHAPALDASTRVAVPWTVDTLTAYLRGDLVGDHEVAAGPMLPVVRNLATIPEHEVRAMASYLVSLQRWRDAARPPSPEADTAANRAAPAGREGSGRNATELATLPGAPIWRGACAPCHGPGRDAPEGALRLGLSTTARLSSPRNFVQIVVHGIQPAEGERGPWMPAFGGALTDRQIDDLAQYVRARFGGGAEWTDVETTAREVRQPPGAARGK